MSSDFDTLSRVGQWSMSLLSHGPLGTSWFWACCRFNNKKQANKRTRRRVLSPSGSRESDSTESSHGAWAQPQRGAAALHQFTGHRFQNWLGFNCKPVNVSLGVNVHLLLISFHRPPFWAGNSRGVQGKSACKMPRQPRCWCNVVFPKLFGAAARFRMNYKHVKKWI